MKENVKKLVEKFGMKQHPEGGYYVEIHRSKAEVNVPKDVYGEDKRTALTSIYFLLTSDNFSAWHKVKSDEIWNYHSGSSLTLISIDKNGQLQKQILGDFLHNEKSVYQITIPADTWFCASVNDKDSYSFIGCAVGPGFEFPDFILADRIKLKDQFPQHEGVITQYTRQPEEKKAKTKI